MDSSSLSLFVSSFSSLFFSPSLACPLSLSILLVLSLCLFLFLSLSLPFAFLSVPALLSYLSFSLSLSASLYLSLRKYEVHYTSLCKLLSGVVKGGCVT